MAADILLLVEGIKGESSDAEHPEAMALTSWTLGGGRGIAGTGAGAERTISDPTVSELVVTCSLEQMTVQLANFATKKKPAPSTVTLIQRRPGGTDPAPTALEVKFEEVYVSSISYSGGPGDLPQCSLSFNFARMTFTYFPQATEGGQSMAAFGWLWDAAAFT